MKRICLSFAWLLLAMASSAQSKTVSLDEAGQLASKISADEKYSITDLKIVGNMNLADFKFLREMCGADENMNETAGKVKILDLSEANVHPSNWEYDEFTGHPIHESGEYELYFWRTTGKYKPYWDTINYYTPYLKPNTFDAYLFAGCNQLETITIPNSLTGFMNRPFEGCANLKEILIADNQIFVSLGGILYTKDKKVILDVPKSIAGIVTLPKEYFTWYTGSLFAECQYVTAFEVEDGNENLCSVNGVLYSKDMTRLFVCPKTIEGEFVIPNSVTTIMQYAFEGCKGLLSVVIPEGVKEIEASAFNFCSSLKNVILPSGLTGDLNAFTGCTSLETVSIPENVISVGGFRDCISLRQIELGCTEKIGYEAFAGCTSLESIVFPASVKEIESAAFYKSGLKEVILPERLQTIADGLFYECRNLEKVVIGEHVTAVWHGAFWGCNALKTICVNASEPPVCSKDESGSRTVFENVFDGVSNSECRLYVPTGALSNYQSAAGWRSFVNIAEGDPSGINGILTHSNHNPQFYSIAGVAGRTTGVNIIRNNDGSIQKVFVKSK